MFPPFSLGVGCGYSITLDLRICVFSQYFKMEIQQIFAHSLILTRPMLGLFGINLRKSVLLSSEII